MNQIVEARTKDGVEAEFFGGNAWIVREVAGRFEVAKHDVGAGGVEALDSASFWGVAAPVATRSWAESNRRAMVWSAVEIAGFGRREMEVSGTVRTPNGEVVDSRINYAEGVDFYGTPGHGFFKLSAKLNGSVPEPYRSRGGWYEEDEEWAKVAAALPELFSNYERHDADRILMNSYPDEYATVTGVTPALSQSRELRRRAFAEQAAAAWVVVSALWEAGDPSLVRCTATLAGARGVGERRTFLVPAVEYRIGEFGFVIDEARHEEVLSEAAPGPR